MTYRPLTDEDLEKVRRGSFVSPEHEVISRLTQQASRANALAAVARCPHISYEYPSACGECDFCKALAAYYGEDV